jgi:hypothetical protein
MKKQSVSDRGGEGHAFSGEKGNRETGAGVLTRNNVSCKRLMCTLPLGTQPRIGITS